MRKQRKQTYVLSVSAAVLGAAGYLLRRFQLVRGVDETGFFRTGFLWRVLPALLLLAFAAGLVLLSRRLGRDLGDCTEVQGSWVCFGVMLLAGLLLIYTGIGWFQYPVGVRFPRLYLLRAVFSLLAGVGLPCLALPDRRGRLNTLRCAASGVLILYDVLHLICTYMDYSFEPDTWVYVLQVLVPCADMLTAYYFAGYFFGKPRPRCCPASAAVTAMLALTALADGGSALGVAASALAAVGMLWMSGEAVQPPAPPAEAAE